MLRLSIVYIGGFEASRDWGDLYSLLFFGLVGWLMKQFKWPRPPLILGVVLGDTIERYLFISIERYGVSWFARPIVALLFLMAFFGVVRPLLQDIRIHGGVRKMLSGFQAPVFRLSQLFTIFVIVVVACALMAATGWGFKAQIVPVIVGCVAFVAASLSLFNDMCRKPDDDKVDSIADKEQKQVEQKIHMDMTSDTGHLELETIIRRAILFFSYLITFMFFMWVMGLIPTALCFVIIFMRVEGPERWNLVLIYATCVVVGVYVAFDQFMAVPWPQTLIGTYLAPTFPFLKLIPSL
jgi:hypothetical protein